MEVINMKKGKKFKAILEIYFGILLVDLGFYYFLAPINLVTGGVNGLALICNSILPELNISIFMYIFNGIALILGLIFLGRDFFLKTIYASILSPTIILLLEFTDASYFISTITEGKYIIAWIVSSILMSLGIGISIRNNGSSGGMDVIQLIISKYLHVPLSKAMYFTDLVIVLLGGFSFVGGFGFNIETVVYGAVCVFSVGYLVDFIALHGRFMRTAYIITEKPDEIKKVIFEKIGRGLTIVDVKGGFTGDLKSMIICTLDKSECYRL